ncbi:hypothetical protein CAC42_2360 [Sphaceloma murrayae]|uniref:ASST-domain-containing protein n=1 Tax=Sphaceloma murrayae TaxID=2082308 RepID=A0A2K1QJJ9_9PEZI|nr:hypothetical protein CAC42_2360 [Sphaceloma murrayae]
MYNDQGEAIWVEETEGQAYDLKAQEIEGKYYLTYWQGDDRVRGHGSGEWVVLDSSYEEQGRISALEGLSADLHELAITKDSTALITAYEIRWVELSDADKADGTPGQIYTWDCLFQEIDLANNTLMFEWRASDHYSIADSFHGMGHTGTADNPFDWFHINSVQKDKAGNYLVSARYTHSITYVDGRTGEIIWIFGGKRNYFEDLSDGLATDFAWQHDARLHDVAAFPRIMRQPTYEDGHGRQDREHQLLTLFDNAAEDFVHSREYSRGLLLELKYPIGRAGGLSSQERRIISPSQEYTARLIRSFVHPENISSSSQGSMQVLESPTLGEDPTILIGYGFNAVWTIFDANGSVLCDAHFAPESTWETGEVQSYRAHQGKWVGRPRGAPKTALPSNYSERAVFISWNGATEVRQWLLQSAMYSHKRHWLQTIWHNVTIANWSGFETRIDFSERRVFQWLRVAAIDKHGSIIGVSEPMDMGRERIKHLVRQSIIAAIHTQKLFLLTHVAAPLLALLIVFAYGMANLAQLHTLLSA